MPLVILELLLKIVLLAMEGQPPEVRAEFWRLYLDDVKAFRALFVDHEPPVKAKRKLRPRRRS